MSARPVILTAASLLLIAALGVVGYIVGETQAPTAAEATEAREAAYAEARESAQDAAAVASRKSGAEEGLAEGRKRGERAGRRAGERAGKAAAGEQLAAVEAEQAAEAAAVEPVPQSPTPAESGLEYSEVLPHGEPGYLLPEEERSLSCIGVDADTGECIGD